MSEPTMKASATRTGHAEGSAERHVAAWFIAAFALILLFGLTACEVLPTAKLPDGSMVTGGGSIFTKSQSKWVKVTHPNGLSMEYATTGHDETVVPVKAAGSYTTLGLAKEARQAFDKSESTKVTLGEQAVSKNATNKAAASTDLKTLNPVEEAIPTQTPSPIPRP